MAQLPNRVPLPKIVLLISCFVTACFAGPALPVQAQRASETLVRIAAAEPPYVNVLLDLAPVRFPVTPYVEDGTTMVPLRALGEAVGAKIGWDGTRQAATYSKDGITLVIQIGQTTISTSDGQPVPMPKPAVLLDGHTMVPLRLFIEILGYHVRWDEATRTVYISSPEGSTSTGTLPGLWGFYALGSVTYSSWVDVFGARYPYSEKDCAATKMEGLFLGWYAVDKHGKVTSGYNPTGFHKPDGWPSVILEARLHGLKLMSMYFADSTSDIGSILDDPVLRRRLALDIASSSADYDGVLIDFEGLGLDEVTAERDKTNFNEFLALLRDFLGKKTLAVALPPLSSPYKGYDHAYIGDIADFIVLMAYNFQDPGSPSPVAPFSRVDDAIRQECELVSPDKIILGIPAYGVLYKIPYEGEASAIALPPARDKLATFPEYPGISTLSAGRLGDGPVPVFVPQFLCNYAEWEGIDGSYKAYLEDSLSLKVRIRMAQRYGISGVAIWRLGLLPENWWTDL